MGLLELLKAGASLKRTTYNFTTDALTSGSASIGSSYGILNISTNVPCRLRLYDNLQSLNTLGEAARSFGNTSVSESIALVGDFSMSVANTTYTIDPLLYGIIENKSAGWTYYRINDASSPPTITVQTYPIEDTTVTIAEANRRTLPNITASLGVGGITSGTLATNVVTVPATYLLVSASLNTNLPRSARLRLYRTTSSLYDTVEKNRVFSVEASESAQLIVDMIVTSSQTTYFSPKIVGANLQNMTSNLALMRGNSNLIDGRNEIYYILENVNTTGGTVDISASLHVYSLEE